MSANEVALGLLFLDSKLRGDATLMAILTGGLYRSEAPPETVPPFGVYAFSGGKRATTMQGYGLLADTLFIVKAVGPASISTTLASAASRIDVLLGGPPGGPVSGVVTGGIISACYQETPLWMDTPPVNGEIQTEAGGIYRMQIQQSF